MTVAEPLVRCTRCGAQITPDEQTRTHHDSHGRPFVCHARHVLHDTQEDCTRAVARERTNGFDLPWRN